MPQTFNTTFNINEPSTALNQGDKLIFKLIVSSSSTNDFTASFSGSGNVTVYSLAASTGYATTACPFLSSASMATGSNSNEIIFTSGISSFYDNGYMFVPNPLTFF